MTDPIARAIAEALRPVVRDELARLPRPAPVPAPLAEDDRVAVRVAEAARLLDVSARTVEELIADGALPSFLLRSCRLIRVADLHELAARGVGLDRDGRRAEADTARLRSLIRRRAG